MKKRSSGHIDGNKLTKVPSTQLCSCVHSEHRENGVFVYVVREEEHTSIEKAGHVIHYHLPRPLEVGIALQDTPITGAGLQHTIAETWRLGGSEDAVVLPVVLSHTWWKDVGMSVYQAMRSLSMEMEHRSRLDGRSHE
jgi:hypothetical protein